MYLQSLEEPQTMRPIPTNMAERLIVALDVSSPTDAEEIVNTLGDTVSFYKIGLWLLFAEGTDALISRLIDRRKNVFLDYKMFDIGETVHRGVERAKERGIKFVTVHGDSDIIRSAVKARGNSDFLKIFTITVLTSMNENDLREMGYSLTVPELIKLRVENSIKYGADGIIASAADNPDDIRKIVSNQALLIATPGIRLSGTVPDDHKRPATPADAIRDGADYIILGRPIIANRDPKQQALDIIRQMEDGAASRPR